MSLADELLADLEDQDGGDDLYMESGLMADVNPVMKMEEGSLFVTMCFSFC